MKKRFKKKMNERKGNLADDNENEEKRMTK